MLVTAWNNGRHHKSGAGYGLKISNDDRDRFFDRTAKTITIELPNGHRFDVNIDKQSFWGTACRELISKEIGEWLIDNGLAPWPKGKPPRFTLTPNREVMKLTTSM